MKESEKSPEPDDYQTRQAQWIKDNKLEIGDMVKVTRSAKYKEDGWLNHWTEDMDELIGIEISLFQTNSEFSLGLKLGNFGGFNLPYFVLEPVSKPEEKPWARKEESEDKLREYIDGLTSVDITSIKKFVKESLPEDGDEKVNPPHYKSHPSGVECIQITEHFNFCLGNALKYIWRCHNKHDTPLDDLKKAQWYVTREIDRIEKLNGDVK